MALLLLTLAQGQVIRLHQELGSLQALPDSVGRRIRGQPQHEQQQPEGPEMPAQLHSLLAEAICPQKDSAAQACPKLQQKETIPAFSQPSQEGHLHPEKDLPQDGVPPNHTLLLGGIPRVTPLWGSLAWPSHSGGCYEKDPGEK